MSEEIAAVRAELHESVRQVLTNEAWSTRRPPAPGTDGAFGRAQFYYDCLGDGDAVVLLERMNVTIFRLRQALLSGDEADYQAQRRELKRLSAAWLYHAPLHRIADLLPPEGEA
jgi:hypothetical protein